MCKSCCFSKFCNQSHGLSCVGVTRALVFVRTFWLPCSFSLVTLTSFVLCFCVCFRHFGLITIFDILTFGFSPHLTIDNFVGSCLGYPLFPAYHHSVALCMFWVSQRGCPLCVIHFFNIFCWFGSKFSVANPHQFHKFCFYLCATCRMEMETSPPSARL